MAAPTQPEYGTASNYAYTLTASGGFVVPAGWSVVALSPTAQQADGFAAVALRDPSGNLIIANEGSLPGVDPYGRGTLSADSQIMNGRDRKSVV